MPGSTEQIQITMLFPIEELKAVIASTLADFVGTSFLRIDQPAGDRGLSNPNESPEPILVSKKQTAEMLQVSVRTVDRLATENLMPQPCRIGNVVRWNRHELIAWINQGCPGANLKTNNTNISTKQKTQKYATRAASSKVTEKPKSAKATIRSNRRQTTKTTKCDTSASKGSKRPPSETDQAAPSVFAKFLQSIGIDRDPLPNMTNGELMKIAEVDIPTMHGWMHLGRALPDEAKQKLKVHFFAVAQDMGIVLKTSIQN